ncbi:MAG: hypothetical protein Q9217_005179 [Psora testacea]
MGSNGVESSLPMSLLTFLLGKPDSPSFEDGINASPPWFSSDQPFCVSAKSPATDRYTFAELKDYVKQLASGLRNAGMQPGDRLMLISPNTIYVPVVMLATIAACGIFVSRDADLTIWEYASWIQHSQPKLILAHEGCETIALEAARQTAEKYTQLYSFGRIGKPRAGIIDGLADWNVLFDEVGGPNFQWQTSMTGSEMDSTVIIQYTSG